MSIKLRTFIKSIIIIAIFIAKNLAKLPVKNVFITQKQLSKAGGLN